MLNKFKKLEKYEVLLHYCDFLFFFFFNVNIEMITAVLFGLPQGQITLMDAPVFKAIQPEVRYHFILGMKIKLMA